MFQVPDQNNNGDDNGDGNGGGGGNNGGRDCSGDGLLTRIGAIACVFSTNTDSGRRIDLYYIDSNSQGHFVLNFMASALGSPPSSGETLFTSGTGGPYTFHIYHKANGDLRITGGPNQDGETHEVTISLTPPSTGGTATSTPAPTSAPSYQAVHTVQTGETLYSIASQYGVTVQAIADANNIGSDYIIHVGNQLNIPNP